MLSLSAPWLHDGTLWQDRHGGGIGCGAVHGVLRYQKAYWKHDLVNLRFASWRPDAALGTFLCAKLRAKGGNIVNQQAEQHTAATPHTYLPRRHPCALQTHTFLQLLALPDPAALCHSSALPSAMCHIQMQQQPALTTGTPGLQHTEELTLLQGGLLGASCWQVARILVLTASQQARSV